MHDELRKRLIDKGVEFLADTLLSFADRDQAIADALERSTATQAEHIKRCRSKLAALTRGPHSFAHSPGADDTCARILEQLLDEIREAQPDPALGLELVAEFYETDEHMMNVCDDSYGTVASVYTNSAAEAFFLFARSCEDRDAVAALFLRIVLHDGYGVRLSLAELAGESLEEADIRRILSLLGDQEQYTWVRTTLERQLQQAIAFREALEGKDGVHLSARNTIRLARTLLERGDTESAIAWIDTIPDTSYSVKVDARNLLKEIYRRQGNTEKLFSLLYESFSRFRTINGYHEILHTLDQNDHASFLGEELSLIDRGTDFDTNDATFLLELGLWEELDTYVLKRAAILDGSEYYILPVLADGLGDNGRHLASTIIYRSLLDSLLERGYSKAYHHGVTYLQILDRQAEQITGWEGFPPHENYKAGLYQEYRRKYTFWRMYQHGE